MDSNGKGEALFIMHRRLHASFDGPTRNAIPTTRPMEGDLSLHPTNLGTFCPCPSLAPRRVLGRHLKKAKCAYEGNGFYKREKVLAEQQHNTRAYYTVIIDEQEGVGSSLDLYKRIAFVHFDVTVQ